MTGRDLILYIMSNELENESIDAILSSAFVSPKELARKFGVGEETVKAWYALGLLSGFIYGGNLYVALNSTDPRKRK